MLLVEYFPKKTPIPYKYIPVLLYLEENIFIYSFFSDLFHKVQCIAKKSCGWSDMLQVYLNQVLQMDAKKFVVSFFL